MNIIRDLFEGLLISLRALRANKMRSFLTTIGIVIGIVAVTTMSTAIVGLEEAFLDSISSVGSDVLYIDKFEWFGGKDWHYYRNRKDIDFDQYLRLKARLKEVKAIAPYKRTFGRTVKNKGNSADATFIFGTTEQYEITSGIIPDEGRYMNELEVKAGRRVCIIGKDIAELLFPREDAIGNSIKLRGVSLKVIGILEKQGAGFLGSPSQDGQIIIPIKVFERIFGSRRGQMRIAVKVNDEKDLPIMKEQIKEIMRVVRKVPPGKPDDFAVNQQDAIKKAYDSTIGVIALAGIFITALSLFVGAIGIMNIMFVSVTERTKEIGIRKAIGAKTWSILFQFLTESAIICLIGGLIGVMISFPISLIINQFLPTSMPIQIVVLALFISAIVGIISGFLPAYKASKLNPVEALRYE